MRASKGGMHVSGAEGLYSESEVGKAIRELLRRAKRHPRGKADSITLTVEKLKKKPREITSLKVRTLQCRSPFEARRIAALMLGAEDVSPKAVKAAFGVVAGARVMRGAALVSSDSGMRLEQDFLRGLRTSRLGIARRQRAVLGRKLSRRNINNATVREALVLASKAASCKGLVAELCISDDPNYTTGYVASKRLGYVRIPNMKKKGSPRGGRAYFVSEGADIDNVVQYLEKTPVLVAATGDVEGRCSADEFLRGINS